MNDAEYDTQKARIQVLIDRWVRRIGLGWWDLSFEYVRAEFEVDGKPAPETSARCTANWRYGHAHLAFNMPRVADLEDQDLERCFVHELMHIFLNEARESGDDWLDHEERVASTLTKAFLWLRDDHGHPAIGTDGDADTRVRAWFALDQGRTASDWDTLSEAARATWRQAYVTRGMISPDGRTPVTVE